MLEITTKDGINIDALEIKMSSRIIAEITGKKHFHIVRDIRDLIENFNRTKNGLVENDKTEIDHSHKIMVDNANELNQSKTALAEDEFSDYVFELSEYKDAKGEMRPEYLLTKKQLLLLISGYDVVLRAKIIDRLEELEKHQYNLEVEKMEELYQAKTKKMESSFSDIYKMTITLQKELLQRELEILQLERNKFWNDVVDDAVKNLKVKLETHNFLEQGIK